MPINILMPALSPTMEEGTLARWLKKEGDTVASGDVIAEIETDKATMEFEAVEEGVLGRIVVPEGAEGVKVNDVIAVLLEEGESADDLTEGPEGGAAAPAKAEAPKPAKATPPADAKKGEATPPAAAAKEGRAPPADARKSETRGNGADALPAGLKGYGAAEGQPVEPEPQGGERVFASPLARRIAKEKGLDLGALKGSGPHGRIVKADVEAAEPGAAPATPEGAPAEARAEAPAEAPAEPAPAKAASVAAAGLDAETVKKAYADRAFEEVKLDGMRRTIAARLSEAKSTIPHFYLRRDIELDALLKFRGQLNKELEARGVKLSVNDFIIKACALALQAVPDCNAVWAGDRVLKLKPSDVAVAVAIEGGLFTPVIRDAETKTLSAISAEMKDLAARARARKLAPHEYQGGTFAISNLGMMGIENFDAVINPPHASILAVGAGVAKPVARDGEIVVATVMSTTLSVDHRVIDGALGAAFLAAVKGHLEAPLGMLA